LDEAEQIIEDGKQAELLINSPVFAKAIEQAKSEAVNDFANSAPTDNDKRESAYFMLKAIEKLEYRLRSIEQNGKFEKEKLSKKQKN